MSFIHHSDQIYRVFILQEKIYKVLVLSTVSVVIKVIDIYVERKNH